MLRRMKTTTLIFVIASFLLLVFPSCSRNAPDSNRDVNNNVNHIIIDSNKWKGKTIIFSFPFMLDDEMEAKRKVHDTRWLRGYSSEVRKAFEDATGASVINKPVPLNEDYFTKILADISAGIGPDIIEITPDAKPAYLIKGLLTPLSDHIDFTKQVYQDSSYISLQIKDYYTWNGKVYGMYKVTPSFVLYYNKKAFRDLGLEDPLELWKKEQWNWKAFRDSGSSLNEDSNGDGTIDRWGYASFLHNEAFIYSNGVEYVTFDESGLPKFALDEKFIRAMQEAEDAIKKYKYVPEAWWDPNPNTRFENGQTCMNYWIIDDATKLRNIYGDDLGMVPFPLGPDITMDIRSRDIANSPAVAITSCSENPDLAALYLEWVYLDDKANDSWKDQLLEYYGSEQMLELGLEWSSNAPQLSYSGFGEAFSNIINAIIYKPENESWEQVLNNNRASAQAALDENIVE